MKFPLFMVALAEELPGRLAPLALWLIRCAEWMVLRRVKRVAGAIEAIARYSPRPMSALNYSPVRGQLDAYANVNPWGSIMGGFQQAQDAKRAQANAAHQYDAYLQSQAGGMCQYLPDGFAIGHS